MTTTAEPKARNLTPAELAAVVRMLRELRGWSQEQLAEISGLSARTVQRVEEGLPSSVDTRRALARGFGFEDIDGFNKPYVIPTPEEAAAAKERFEKEHVTLKVERVETGKQLAGLAERCDAVLFSDSADLSGRAAELFAGLSDYCRDYGDCASEYSATDKLAVYNELSTQVADLAAEGVCLAAATRPVVFKCEATAAGMPTHILYVVAFPNDRIPEHIAVQRQVRFA
jgi:transcriptional regulator with XRE-family HTH domain